MRGRAVIEGERRPLLWIIGHRLWEFIAFGVVDVSLSIVMLLGLGAVLLTLDWRLGLVMTLPVPLFCSLIYWHGESLEGLFIRGWRKWGRCRSSHPTSRAGSTASRS